MPALVCMGDATTHGGKVISASASMFINGIQVALLGDRVSCPAHGPNNIIEGDTTVMDNGIAVVVDGSLCACGCRVISTYTDTCVES
ncbi:PAAR domain-containing protein [Enterobacteriaceae bacterium 4M9]|nr:PAAR domain-containing protein [Enterobacteriaceae bacterium 4M9]